LSESGDAHTIFIGAIVFRESYRPKGAEMKKPSREAVIFACAVAVILIIGSIGGAVWYTNMKEQERLDAVAACEQSQTDLADALSILSKSVTSAKDVLDSTQDQVADDAVRTSLDSKITTADSLTSSNTKKNACPTTMAEATDEATKNDAALKNMKDATTDLASAQALVEDAHKTWLIDQAKQKSDATKTALIASIESAKTTLADSDGKVSDNSVRDTLQQAITSAEELVNAEETAKTADEWNALEASYTASKSALDTAAQNVAEARNAWQAEQDRKNSSSGSGDSQKSNGDSGGGASSSGGVSNDDDWQPPKCTSPNKVDGCTFVGTIWGYDYQCPGWDGPGHGWWLAQQGENLSACTRV